MKYWLIFSVQCYISAVLSQNVDSISIKKVDSLILVSRNYTAMRDYQNAMQINDLAEKIVLEKLGKESSAYGSICFNRARVHYNVSRNYAESEKWYLKAKEIWEKTLGHENRSYANCINNLAVLYYESGKYSLAETLYLESKGIRERVLGKRHPDYAASLTNLSNINSLLGNYIQSEAYLLEAKNIREEVLGKEHPDYALNLNNLAVLYFRMGEYEKAEPLYLETKSIREKVLGKEHPDYAMSLNNLAALYLEMANYDKAEMLYIEALDILKKILGKEHHNYADCLNNLGLVNHKKGNYAKANQFFLEGMAIREKLWGKLHSDYANSLINLSALYFEMGSFDKSENHLLEAMNILEKVLGKEHPFYATTVNNLAIFYNHIGKYEKAESLFLQCKAIQKKVLGDEHADYLNNLSLLAELYENMGETEKAEKLLHYSSEMNYSKMIKSASFLSEQELGNYISLYEKNMYKIGSYMLKRSRSESSVNPGVIPSLLYDQSLFHKGFLLQAVNRLSILALTTPETEEIHNRLKAYRRRLSIEYSKPASDRKGVSELEEKANTAEKELARSLVGYTEVKRQVKWEEVLSTLKIDEAAIEFVSFKVNFPSRTDSVMYAALVLKSGSKQPNFIPLFEEKSLDSLLHSKSDRKADYVNSLYTLADRGAIAIEATKKSLYEILWKPLEKELTGIKTIYFSPTGLLHRINLDAIPISETETLADKYQLTELNSTRQLVVPTQLKNVNNEAVLFGGIQFDQDSLSVISEPIYASRSRGQLSFKSVDSTLRGGIWNYLAGTEREVNSIEKIMQTSGIHTTLKKGYFAIEESFKNIGVNNNPSPRILHIATHGYFFSDTKNNSQESQVNNQNENVFTISDHPMLRSGLIMAGGNVAWQGKQTLEGREDGILTAYEISQMNLSNTELVVLSACETGLGDIQGNEGVYGLQRAFKIAGAKYLIMSLWQVPDKQTSLLMTTFYKKWLEAEGPDKGGNKMSIPEAFHAAQKELREIGLDPYQWAGFVLVE
ncbi:MAG: CHAT domain-containing protein [Saprospiraceae bacterium]|nr:CHAT domain-containing protein [Saprospiraceae bacterium]